MMDALRKQFLASFVLLQYYDIQFLNDARLGGKHYGACLAAT
jgi:hypothetical protein